MIIGGHAVRFEQAERLDRSSPAAVNNLGLVCMAQVNPGWPSTSPGPVDH